MNYSPNNPHVPDVIRAHKAHKSLVRQRDWAWLAAIGGTFLFPPAGIALGAFLVFKGHKNITGRIVIHSEILDEVCAKAKRWEIANNG